MTGPSTLLDLQNTQPEAGLLDQLGCISEASSLSGNSQYFWSSLFGQVPGTVWALLMSQLLSTNSAKNRPQSCSLLGMVS